MDAYLVVEFIDLGYHCHSVWLDKNKADEECARLNAKSTKPKYDVECVALNGMGEVCGSPAGPYLVKYDVVALAKYNPAYGDDRMCVCGHSYYRHFDSYEDDEAVGCKYCACYEFVEATNDNEGNQQ